MTPENRHNVNPNTPPQNNGGGGVYFILGALVVAVAIMGYFFMDNNDADMNTLEPASGIERTDTSANTFDNNNADMNATPGMNSGTMGTNTNNSTPAQSPSGTQN